MKKPACVRQGRVWEKRGGRGGVHREINTRQNRALTTSAANVVPVSVCHIYYSGSRALNQIQLCEELVLSMQRQEKFTSFSSTVHIVVLFVTSKNVD